MAWEALTAAAYSVRDGGTLQVSGSVGVLEENVTAEVEVEPATVESVDVPQSVSVPAGVAPELPESAQVTWSNGDVTEEQVVWAASDPTSYASGDAYEVTGTVAETSTHISTEVEVADAVATSVADADIEVSAPSGTAPELPETVQVIMSDGTEAAADVEWEAFDETSVGEDGTAVATGTVQGSDGLTVKATVQVTAPEVDVPEVASSEVASPEVAPSETAADENRATESRTGLFAGIAVAVVAAVGAVVGIVAKNRKKKTTDGDAQK